MKINRLMYNLNIMQKSGNSIKNQLKLNYFIKKTPIKCCSYSTKIAISSDNATIIEQLYNSWLKNPESVHPSWSRYFNESQSSYTSTKSINQSIDNKIDSNNNNNNQAISNENKSVFEVKNNLTIEDHLNVQSVIRSYQSRGHFVADLDPLGIKKSKSIVKYGLKRHADELVTKTYFKFNEKHFDQEFQLPDSTFIGGNTKSLKLRDIIERLENVYCNKIGIEYMHITDLQQIQWIREKFETPNVIQFTKDQKQLILKRLTRATGFESFLQKKYPSEKRFGLEGCEILIPALKNIIDVSSSNGIQSIVMGIAHRGRLNTLANVCRKPLHHIFTQFAGLEPTDAGSGDVKYHLGTFVERLNRATNKNIRLAIVANPSHLEAVNPIVQGKTCAEQVYSGDTQGKQVMSILLHGDASNCGQGIVYETMHLSDLPDYTTHGTIHLIINNQIGFTTDPRFSRSSPYCTDVARVVNAPIFHVNADDPEAVIYCSTIAAEWRAIFHKDVVIDLVSYRRNGHNELDDPMQTQPLMYQRINQLKTCLDQYEEKLIKEGITTKEDIKLYSDKYEKICQDAFDMAKSETTMKFKDWLDSPWSGFFEGRNMNEIKSTGIAEKTLQHIGIKFSSPPPNGHEFILHKSIERILVGRQEMIKNRLADWAIAEAFAFGSLLKDGHHVRLSGQDVERGTFAHRHHVLHHQTIDKYTYQPLCHLYPDQAQYCVHNSSLSESAVLGFEIGYSLSNPNSLIIWEGQFGDFVNNAQCMIDQFISCGQQKWVRQSGIVLLLPHGMEGMGPEHSSCRLERFLQLSDDDSDNVPKFDNNIVLNQLSDINWIVANCSTPANLFHILRRQLALPFRKPLILATPKSLLRLPECRSSFDDMIEGTEFQRVIPENDKSIQEQSQSIEKLIFCSGKVYYDLIKERTKRNANNNQGKSTAIVRIEQICPFPYDLIEVELKRYPKAHLIWAQEEHKNQGCWTYVQPRIAAITCASERCIYYHGRPPAAAPATGSKHQYLKELNDFMNSVFGPLGTIKNKK